MSLFSEQCAPEASILGLDEISMFEKATIGLEDSSIWADFPSFVDLNCASSNSSGSGEWEEDVMGSEQSFPSSGTSSPRAPLLDWVGLAPDPERETVADPAWSTMPPRHAAQLMPEQIAALSEAVFTTIECARDKVTSALLIPPTVPPMLTANDSPAVTTAEGKMSRPCASMLALCPPLPRLWYGNARAARQPN